MLLFIKYGLSHDWYRKEISIHLMLLFIVDDEAYYKMLKEHFNTSHVTVYRYKPVVYADMPIFQYISCYCLSPFVSLCVALSLYISIHLMLLFIGIPFSTLCATVAFQYISCYCLSRKLGWIRGGNSISIHLMLLFIVINIWICTTRTYFNTSHVTVYHFPRIQNPNRRKFQYISCYCLSSQTS